MPVSPWAALDRRCDSGNPELLLPMGDQTSPHYLALAESEQIDYMSVDVPDIHPTTCGTSSPGVADAESVSHAANKKRKRRSSGSIEVRYNPDIEW